MQEYFQADIPCMSNSKLYFHAWVTPNCISIQDNSKLYFLGQYVSAESDLQSEISKQWNVYKGVLLGSGKVMRRRVVTFVSGRHSWNVTSYKFFALNSSKFFMHDR